MPLDKCLNKVNPLSSRQHLLRVVMLLLAIFLTPNTLAAGSQGLEYKVKAAFLYNFIRFVKWPGDDVADPSGDINVCIIGDDPFGETISPINRRKAKGQTIKVLRLDDSDSRLETCKILFMAIDDEKKIGSISDRLESFTVLTVGESTGFAEQGGIIGFVIKDGLVRLEINLERAKRAGMVISAKLLEIAIIVSDKEKGSVGDRGRSSS